MAETNAQKIAREAKEAEARELMRAELKAELEAEHAAELENLKIEAARAQQAAVEDATLTATSAHAQAIPAVIVNDPETEESVTVHFVGDGLTALGKVWYRGEQITVAPGTPNWEALTDKATGTMVLSLNEAQQVTRWGRRHFAPGPWPYGGFELADENLSDKDRELLRTIQEKQAIRSR